MSVRSKTTQDKMRMSRRALLKAGAASGAAAAFPLPAYTQTRTVKYTLAWLAQGTSAFAYAGKEKGFFRSRGIDLQISRGYGSLAAAQAVAAGQFDIGYVFSAPLILMIAKGLPLRSIAVTDYDATMGVGVLADGGIKTPADLAGKKMGTVPTSADSPFFPAYAERAGIDTSKIEMISVDAKVIERVLSDKQVDAVTGIGTSSLPVLLSRKIPVRWMLYSATGMKTYGGHIVTTPGVLEKDPGLCAAMVEGLAESLAFSLTNSDEAAELFFKAVPEAGLNASARDFIRIGMGLHRCVVAKSEAIQHGFGWADPAVIEATTDLVMKYNVTPDTPRPAVDSWFSNKLGGTIKLTPAQWTTVEASTSEFKAYLS
jgi:ABC-type nitrate/sulfonate/bicarbonate transport system substrate-binding protein